MYSPLQLNLGKLSYDRTYEILIPFVPGGALVLLLMFGRPCLISHASAELGLGRYLMTAALISGAYITGFILQFLSAAFYVAISILISWRLRNRKFQRPNPELSRKPVWCALATEFLGKSLAPAAQNPGEIEAVETQWQEWYNVLQDYFREKPTVLIPSTMMQSFMAVEGTGWAIVVAEFAFATHRHWEMLTTGALLILLPVLVPHYIQLTYLNFHAIQHWLFEARLLRELRPLVKPNDDPATPK